MTDPRDWMLPRDLNTVTVGEWMEAYKRDGVTVVLNDGKVFCCVMDVVEER
ncbi:MAG: hypothetical protein LUE96_07390 [Lachnospiraceae bacterium]|nr:hypothetical protein [Lachnospiraceae bacterium]